MARTTKTKRDLSFLPGDQLLEITNIYIDQFYPYSIRTGNKNSQHFSIQAVAYTDSVIISAISPPDKPSIGKRVNNDIKKLQRVKYPPAHLFYLIDGKILFTDEEILLLNNKLSVANYRVSILDNKKIIEFLIHSYNTPPIKAEGLLTHYEQLYDAPQIEDAVIEDIFYFLHTSSGESIKVEPFENKLLHLKPKIEENFSPHNYRMIRDTYNALWANKESVEAFIKKNFNTYEDQLYTILDKLRNMFRQAPFNNKNDIEFPATSPEFFDKLADAIIPDGKKSDSRYIATAKALVLFFFEYCDFGKKSKTDPPTLFSKFEGKDDPSD